MMNSNTLLHIRIPILRILLKENSESDVPDKHTDKQINCIVHTRDSESDIEYP